jgi:hypothetical protein
MIMCLAWSTSSFCYYLIAYYTKYIPGNIYQIIAISTTIEIFACTFSGFIAEKFGLKNALTFFYFLAAAPACILVFISPEKTFEILICVLISKSSLSGAFNVCYLATPAFFPLVYNSQAFGICNIVARSITMGAYIIAEMQPPIPMLMYTFLLGMSMVASTML